MDPAPGRGGPVGRGEEHMEIGNPVNNSVHPVNPAHRLPAELAQAMEEGRYRPGQGPWYCSRILPETVPVHRQELLASGVTRWTADTRYVAVAPGVLLPGTGETVGAGTRDGTRGRTRDGTGNTCSGDYGAYRHGIIDRSRAQLMNRPGCVLGDWGAAGFHGLKFWADSAPVLLLSGTLPPRGSDRTSLAARYPLQAVVRAFPPGFDIDRDTVSPDPAFPEFRVVSARWALAQCLRSVLSEKHTWYVVDIPGLTRVEVRAVQLLDAFAQCTTITRAQIREVCRGVVRRGVLEKLLVLSASGSESPRETVLRLFVRDLLPEGFTWETQTGVRYQEEVPWGGVRTRITFFDIGCRGLRIGLYYDGKHHQDAAQTEKDFEQLQDLRDGRWTVIRVNKALMANPRKMLGQVSRAIAAAAAAVDT